jgi:putative ABC transport system permease protein
MTFSLQWLWLWFLKFASMMFVVLLFCPVVFLAVVLCWDKGRRSFVLAVRSLWLHKLRAFLSVLGIIIGTAAVILLMAFGEGSMQDALEDIRRQGATNIIVHSVKLPSDSAAGRRARIATYGITQKDYERFLTLPTIVGSIPMRIFRQEVRVRERMHNGRLVGTEAGYADVNKLQLKYGRFFTEEESHNMKNRVVLGYRAWKALFPYTEAVGESISLGRNLDRWRVVGVLEDRKPLSGGHGGTSEEYNDDVYVPLSSCNRWYGDRVIDRQSGAFTAEQVQLHQVTLTVGTTDQVRPTGESIRELMSQSHVKKDWEVTVPLDRLEAAEREKERYTMLLVMIGGISLLVGGIGIMNIMLATVTERTREIGIRRALGAKRRDITLQFLVEATVQTGVGGIVGVVLGLALMFTIPLVAAMFNEHLPAQVHKYSIFLSLAVSIGVGVLFGWYPARRAALLDPIEALRHE